eukprot:4718403-Pleurochrysis_carterae.AAC.3
MRWRTSARRAKGHVVEGGAVVTKHASDGELCAAGLRRRASWRCCGERTCRLQAGALCQVLARKREWARPLGAGLCSIRNARVYGEQGTAEEW